MAERFSCDGQIISDNVTIEILKGTALRIGNGRLNLDYNEAGIFIDRLAEKLETACSLKLGKDIAIQPFNEHICAHEHTKYYATVTFDSLLDLAITINALNPRDQQIDLTPLQDQAREIIDKAQCKTFLTGKFEDLDKNKAAFRKWANEELKPYLKEVASSTGLHQISRSIATGDLSTRLISTIVRC